MAKNLLLLYGIIFCLAANNVSAGVSDGWEKHVMGDMTSPIYLYVTDMDGDGDLDAVSTSTMHPGLFDSEVAWYQNNLNEGGQWKKIIISSKEPDENPITNTNGIVVSDIDGDGNEDVIVCTGRVTEITGDVYWFKAPDDPEGQWERFDIEVDVMNSYFKIYTIDANEDAMDDIIVGGNQGAMLFINPGNPDQQEAVWEKVALPEDLGETGSSLYLDDLNEDGKTDLLNTYTGAVTDDPGNVSWFDLSYNTADGELIFDRTMIAPELIRAFDVNCVDVNEDSRKDVIVTVFQQPFIYWYEAPENSGGIWTQHLI